MKRWYAVIVLVVTLTIGTSLVRQNPEECVICATAPTHCPCLINLSTGEIGKLLVYDLHTATESKLAPYEEQQTGTFNFTSCAGLTGYRDTACALYSITVPIEATHMKKSLFCVSCQNQLERFSNEGYLIANMYEPGAPVFFPVISGASYQMRCYMITIGHSQDNDSNRVTVYGSIK